jgi:hypothetical protein
MDGVRALPLVAVPLALVGSSTASRAGTACPRDPSLGSIEFVRGQQLHRLSFANCSDRVVGEAPPARPHALAGVVVRDRSLWLRRGTQLVWLTRPLPREYGLSRWPDPVTASPDGRWLVWRAAIDSGSLTADGLPLFVTHLGPGGKTFQLATRALAYSDYVAWCGSTLVYVAGADRIATHDKRLFATAPPKWRPRPLWSDPSRAFGSVACAPDGRSVAVLSQPASGDARFFSTRWQLWRVGLDGSRASIDRPPTGYADESPTWVGEALAFVREQQGRGAIWLHDGTRLLGPLVSLGYSLGFYGHHDWGLVWRR